MNQSIAALAILIVSVSGILIVIKSAIDHYHLAIVSVQLSQF